MISKCWELGLTDLPHALQMVRPASSRRQSGVIVVPQFWHESTMFVLAEPPAGESEMDGLGEWPSCGV